MNYHFIGNADAVRQHPEAGMTRQVLAYNERIMLVRHFFESGWVGARHQHPHEQIIYVVRGVLKVDVAGSVFEVRAGDSFAVEGGVEHQASALEDSEVLDVFTPVREDYRPA